MKIPLFIFALWAGLAACSGNTQTIDLTQSGWSFALDPLARGESIDWHKPDARWDGQGAHLPYRWDAVEVPHDYLSDPAYAYTGTAWYRRAFFVPEDAGALVWRLQFETVFQRCKVWINGDYVGAHEGGYAPFEFSVGKYLKAGKLNFIAVQVDSSVLLRKLPGVRSGHEPNAVMYPWLGYGGILASVRLVGHAPVWAASQKITTTPEPGGWRLDVAVRLRNDSAAAHSGKVTVDVPELGKRLSADYTVGANAADTVRLSAVFPHDAVKTWDIAHTNLYTSKVSLDTGAPEQTDSFGFRNIEIRDARFWVNGVPVRLAGANRAGGHPVYGGIVPDELIAQDMQLMKDAGLVFARIQHTAPKKSLLDWADRNGALLVLEVAMWGCTAEDMASPELRAQFKAEMAELVELAQNHPSVVGWSLGNEYDSWTPEGIAWTKDMAAYVKGLDATRPVTFAALARAVSKLKETNGTIGDHAFDYVDYISLNFYLKPESFASYVDKLHKYWPQKPLAITEFGVRADRVANEQERIDYFDKILAQVRSRPWICGLSFWCFNDYASRYPGTGKDGYRRWGLVDEYRKPRPLYEHVKPMLKDGLDAAKSAQ